MAGNLQLSTPKVTGSLAIDWSDPKTKAQPSEEKFEKKLDSEKSEEQKSLSEKTVSDVADALNSVSKAIDRNLQFSVDKETGRIVIKVTDGDTGELVRMIPPEDISKMRQSFGSLVGLLFNDQS